MNGVGYDVLLGKNEEGIDYHPPHQQDEDIQRAGQHPFALVRLMGTNCHRRHDRDNVQK